MQMEPSTAPIIGDAVTQSLVPLLWEGNRSLQQCQCTWCLQQVDGSPAAAPAIDTHCCPLTLLFWQCFRMHHFNLDPEKAPLWAVSSCTFPSLLCDTVTVTQPNTHTHSCSKWICHLNSRTSIRSTPAGCLGSFFHSGHPHESSTSSAFLALM